MARQVHLPAEFSYVKSVCIGGIVYENLDYCGEIETVKVKVPKKN